MTGTFWIGLALMMGGQVMWLIASERVKSWLADNDPSFEREGVLARLFIGRLFTSFGPVARYTSMRRERGEDTTLTMVFWAGFLLSLVGIVVVFAPLIAR